MICMCNSDYMHSGPPCHNVYTCSEPLHDDIHMHTVRRREQRSAAPSHQQRAHIAPAPRRPHGHSTPPPATTTCAPSPCMTTTTQAHSPRHRHHARFPQNPRMAMTRPQNLCARMKTWAQCPCSDDSNATVGSSDNDTATVPPTTTTRRPHGCHTTTTMHTQRPWAMVKTWVQSPQR